jgi:CDP-glucose 4,6-dehydratase
VIGGGDVCTDRLVPEILKSIQAGHDVELRFPEAVRPWQHVLDCLNGYLAISDELLKTNQSGIWNIGPGEDSDVAVKDICEKFLSLSNSQLSWKISRGSHITETSFLALNSDKSLNNLDWKIQLHLDDAIKWTFQWHVGVQSGLEPAEITMLQVDNFLQLIPRSEYLRAK